MNRRQAVSALVSGLAGGPARAGTLDAFIDNGGAALVTPTGHIVTANAERLRVHPGSTVKPLVLAALMRRGLLQDTDSFLCRGRLRIGDRVFDCVHPPLDAPMHADTALAYSCNCFVAQFAQRLKPEELASDLQAAGLPAVPHRDPRLQALGEDLLAGPLQLARAYRRLAASIAPAILAGLEGAVEYGTARHARVPDLAVAGKTGSARSPAGELMAWFAGFAPSRTPQVALAVVLRGRSGGADAAPVAARILQAWKAGRL